MNVFYVLIIPKHLFFGFGTHLLDQVINFLKIVTWTFKGILSFEVLIAFTHEVKLTYMYKGNKWDLVKFG